MNSSISTQRLALPRKAALLLGLDKDLLPIKNAYASGFVREEADGLWLYTCWHVVVDGYDPFDVRVKNRTPPCRALRVMLQGFEQSHPNVQTIGGLQEVTIPLYEESITPPRPLWFQDDTHLPQPDLNAIGIKVPFFHDVVKIRLPDALRLSSMQIVDELMLLRSSEGLLGPGEKCLVVGFPYGFSALGPQQPTPVALTRFLAAYTVGVHVMRMLLDGPCAPGMSGGPVYIERDERLLLLGIYTGGIFPDHMVRAREEHLDKTTALGTVSNLILVLDGSLRLVNTPSRISTLPNLLP